LVSPTSSSSSSQHQKLLFGNSTATSSTSNKHTTSSTTTTTTTTAVLVSQWRANLAGLLSNRTSGWRKLVTQLGHRLLQEHHHEQKQQQQHAVSGSTSGSSSTGQQQQQQQFVSAAHCAFLVSGEPLPLLLHGPSDHGGGGGGGDGSGGSLFLGLDAEVAINAPPGSSEVLAATRLNEVSDDYYGIKAFQRDED
jgi:hypothetical protein